MDSVADRATGSAARRFGNGGEEPLPPASEDLLFRTLDAVGVRHGAWLSSIGRGCLEVWEPLLTPLRGQQFDLLEIGVGTGASLRTWRDWFPRARLVGVDARRTVLDPPIRDCVLVQGSQTDLATFQPLLREYRFRVIVADGSLHDDDQLQTFAMLFPWLEPDSWYVCAGFDADGDAVMQDASSWFAELGQALASPAARKQIIRDNPTLVQIVPRLKGIFFGRGSVVVSSGP